MGITPEPCRGRVLIVGTGPGDPDLLTVRAARAIGQAEVILYDNLVSAQILALAPASAERHYVGKRRKQHALAQDELNARMIRLAREGRCVLRLKGGDPYVFGRGGEEASALAEAGVPFEVVPGVTAAIGAAAAAGIPLTDRRFAQSCTLVAGQLQDGSLDLDWSALAATRQTIAIYMGLVGLPVLCRELIAHGRDPATPVAVIQQATTPDQRVVIGTLADIAQRTVRENVRPPTIILVGDVVRLHAQINSLAGVSRFSGI